MKCVVSSGGIPHPSSLQPVLAPTVALQGHAVVYAQTQWK